MFYVVCFIDIDKPLRSLTSKVLFTFFSELKQNWFVTRWVKTQKYHVIGEQCMILWIIIIIGWATCAWQDLGPTAAGPWHSWLSLQPTILPSCQYSVIWHLSRYVRSGFPRRLDHLIDDINVSCSSFGMRSHSMVNLSWRSRTVSDIPHLI